ncbi:T-cell leukemia/lymphoma protein 1A [Microtus ochrogaster]|uniref:T-cell leukemia/lymphoma protein 1A n=1 Tax=Microtus ochrogaster TaxID=79684 RepID=A0A8J6H1D3_MICOH|nr:T-cell leukemia/lymphoma protein 1A [Microtus ochrogaster]
MAEAPASGPERLDDPERLWIWERHVYLDEHKRSWLPIILKTDEKLQVIMRQQDVSLGSPMTPEQLTAYELPLLWQLYPGKRRSLPHVKLPLLLQPYKLPSRIPSLQAQPRLPRALASAGPHASE